MTRRHASGKGIFLALVAAASLLLQPACGAFAALAPSAPALSHARHAGGAHGDATGHPAPGNASCCSGAGTPALAGPPSTPHETPPPGPSLSAPLASPPSGARARAGTRTEIAWANAPPPLPFHSRSSRILR